MSKSDRYTPSSENVQWKILPASCVRMWVCRAGLSCPERWSVIQNQTLYWTREITITLLINDYIGAWTQPPWRRKICRPNMLLSAILQFCSKYYTLTSSRSAQNDQQKLSSDIHWRSWNWTQKLFVTEQRKRTPAMRATLKDKWRYNKRQFTWWPQFRRLCDDGCLCAVTLPKAMWSVLWDRI